jgi:hypothetical protein
MTTTRVLVQDYQGQVVADLPEQPTDFDEDLMGMLWENRHWALNGSIYRVVGIDLIADPMAGNLTRVRVEAV